MHKSVTIIIPAYNEAGNIEGALDAVVSAVAPAVPDYEIVVVDDGSRDETAALAKSRARNNPRIRVVSHFPNRGYGYTFVHGVKLATKSYVTVFPGDNDMSALTLRDLIVQIGEADIITSHCAGENPRSRFRKTLSKTFTGLMNLLFGLRLKYYNGSFICRREILLSIPIRSQGLAVLAECLVRIIKKGYTYKSIPFVHTGRKSDQSKALNGKSFFRVSKTILILVRDIYFVQPGQKKHAAFNH